MSKDLFALILNQLQSIDYAGRISFSFYNEPLLVLDLEFYAAEVKAHLPKSNILLYTNGTLLSLSRLESLISAGIETFVVTKHEGEEDFIFDQTLKLLTPEKRNKYIKYLAHTDLKLTNRGGLVGHVKKEVDSSNLPCLIPLHMLTITNQGTVIPCFEDYHQVHSMGTIGENTLEEIWNSKAYVTLRKKLLLGLRKDYDVCSKCNRIEMLGVY